MTIARDEVMRRGALADALLANPQFNEVCTHLANQYANLFFSSAPAEKMKREDAYHTNRALQDLVGQLGQWQQMRDQTLEAERQERIANGDEEPEEDIEE